MEELKTLIKKLLSKAPMYTAFVDNYCYTVEYIHEDTKYYINLYKESYTAKLKIEKKDINARCFTVKLTEKEYMEFKWTIEEWDKYLYTKYFNEFKDFVEIETAKSMDALLN